MGYVIKVDGELYLSRGSQFGTVDTTIALTTSIDKARVWARKYDVDIAMSKLVEIGKPGYGGDIWERYHVRGYEKVSGSKFEIVDVTIKETE